MKNINTIHVLSFLIVTAIVSFMTEQKDTQQTAIDPFQMGKKLATLMKDESVERVVEKLTDLELWSTIISTDSLLEVVYKPANFRGNILEDDDVTYDINSPDVQSAKASTIALVQNNNDKSGKGSVVIYEDDEDPFVVLRVDSYQSVAALRNSPTVEFVALVGLMNEAQNESQRRGDGLIPGRNKSFLDGMKSTNDTPTKGSGDGDGDGGAGPRSGGGCDDPPEESGWFGCCDDDPSSVNMDYDAEGILRVPWHYEEMGIIEANECTYV